MSAGVGEPRQATYPSSTGVTAPPGILEALIIVYVVYELNRVVEVVGVTGRTKCVRDPGVNFETGIIQPVPVPVAAGDYNR